MRLQSMAVFRGLLSDPVVEALCGCLNCLGENASQPQTASAYGELVSRLYRLGSGNLSAYIQRIVEQDENVCICAVGRGEMPPACMLQCLDEELKTLQAAAELTPEALIGVLEGAGWLPRFASAPVDLTSLYHERLAGVSRWGYGIYARHHMFYLDDTGNIIPVRHPDGTRLSDLVDYQRERQLILDNTYALLAGRPAANVLLTGDAGTGKSSTIKAVVNELYPQGLRIIEVRKDLLRAIPALLDELTDNPLKFILFIDDLSFQKGDDSYSALKAVLEGSVSAKSRNIAIYATSNRRHLVRETFSDREGDDIHRGETMQEMLSLSERFGLHITFQKPNKATYLGIVRHLAEAQGTALEPERLEALAERFALERGGRSARAARQFVESLAAAPESVPGHAKNPSSGNQ